MTESPNRSAYTPAYGAGPRSASLADVLELVLDKGIVIAGDIQISLLEIDLLTIKLRLLIASVDRAREMGINWWESDPALSANGQSKGGQDKTGDGPTPRELQTRIEELEAKLADSGGASSAKQTTRRGGPR
jgi:Gas vesicle protein